MRRSAGLATIALAAALAAGCGGGEEPFRIGVLPECRSSLSGAYEPLLAAAELPLIERGAHLAGHDPSDGLVDARVAGREVRLAFGCEAAEQDAFDSVASLLEVRRLVEREGADVMILSTGEPWTLELRDYARRHPGVTFVIGWGHVQSATLRDAAPNVFSFFPNVLQQAAAAGAYAYNRLGWRRAVTVHNDHTWGWTETAGFTAVFCALGGEVVDRVWAPRFGPLDAPAIVKRVRKVAPDGIFLAQGDVALVTALANGLPLLRGNMGDELIGTWWGLGDPSIQLALRERLDGVLTTTAGSAPSGDSLPANARYWALYAKTFPGQPSFWALHGGGTATYVSVAAVAKALEGVRGDLGDGQRRFQEALRDVELDAPNGRLRLDEHRQVIGTGWLTRRKVVNGERTDIALPPVGGIDTTLGGLLGPDSPPPSRTSPPCRRGHAPSWARTLGR